MAKYEIKDGVCVVPEGTVSIFWEDFRGTKELRKLVLPESLVFIQKNALKGCTELRNIQFPESAEHMFYYVAPGGGVCRIDDNYPFPRLLSVLINGGFCVRRKQ